VHIEIEFNTDNAAFDDLPVEAVGYVLNKAALHIEHIRRSNNKNGVDKINLCDYNGNVVGLLRVIHPL